MPVKFNDFFEFPTQLDMSPYTLDYARATEQGTTVSPIPYRLAGVLVHSGQASGGHYYSFAKRRNPDGTLSESWLKFDDSEVYKRITGPLMIEVSEIEGMDEATMRQEWFGGEYSAEVYDPQLKMSALSWQFVYMQECQ